MSAIAGISTESFVMFSSASLVLFPSSRGSSSKQIAWVSSGLISVANSDEETVAKRV